MKDSRYPFVIANFALTADGKVSTRNHTPAQFGSEVDKKRLLKIRASGDAVIAGRRTVETDRMRMSVPGLPPEKSPLRVLISESGNISQAWKVFHSEGAPIVIFTTHALPSRTRMALRENPGVSIHLSRTVRLPKMLATLREEYDVRKLVCEGGPTLFRGLLELGAIDQLHVTISPHLFGGIAAPTLTGVSTAFLRSPSAFRLTKHEVIGEECFLTYRKLH